MKVGQDSHSKDGGYVADMSSRYRSELQIIKKPVKIDWLFLVGAGEAIRTPDPNLGKVMLYPWATPASLGVDGL